MGRFDVGPVAEGFLGVGVYFPSWLSATMVQPHMQSQTQLNSELFSLRFLGVLGLSPSYIYCTNLRRIV